MSESSWVPKTWTEATPYIVWGILAFAFGFEGVGALIHGEWWPATFGLGGMVGLSAMLIHWTRVRQAFGDVRWLVAAMMFAMVVVVLSPYVEQQRWPFASQFHSLLGPTADDVAEAVVRKMPKPSPSLDQRSLGDDRKRKLVTEFAKLRSVTSYIVLSFTNGDGESGNYMQDFADATRRAGLEPRFGFTSQDNPDQIGVIIALKDPTSPPPETEPLRAALQSIGIEPKILGFPSGGFHIAGTDAMQHPDLVLWIAERPL
jgi:hypothetical protein